MNRLTHDRRQTLTLEQLTVLLSAGDALDGAGAQERLASGLGGLTRLGGMLAAWAQRRRTRLHLEAVSPWMLADVGLNEADRERECAKWFWQP